MGTVSADIVLSSTRSVAGSVEDSKSSPDGPTTHFYLTGFAKFHQVAVNPTELLMNALPHYLRASPPDAQCELISADTLQVAAETSRIALDRLYGRIADARMCAGGGVRPVVVHFGVNVGVTRFALEVQARNEATFLCPDELGWTPIMQKIDNSQEKLTSVRQTVLPIDALVKELRTQGFQVDVSTDAGRFVCNWVYYNSLSRAVKSDAVALFVHVPSESVVPIPEQLKFTRALMQCISDLPTL